MTASTWQISNKGQAVFNKVDELISKSPPFFDFSSPIGTIIVNGRFVQEINKIDEGRVGPDGLQINPYSPRPGSVNGTWIAPCVIQVEYLHLKLIHSSCLFGLECQ